MSLLGKLEDLPLTDILQIVYLSRRTGVLEIHNGVGRHSIWFHRGLLVDARSPDFPGLMETLLRFEKIQPGQVKDLEDLRARTAGEPFGNALLDSGLVSADDMAQAQLGKIRAVIQPLLVSDEGEFNFLLRDGITPEAIDYDPKRVFRDGGLTPQKLLAKEGEKIVPLAGLKESLMRGKSLIRGALTGDTSTPETAERAAEAGESGAGAAEQTADGNVLPFRRDGESAEAPTGNEEQARPLAPETLLSSFTPPRPEGGATVVPASSLGGTLLPLEPAATLASIPILPEATAGAAEYEEAGPDAEIEQEAALSVEEEIAESIVPRELDMGELMRDRMPREEARFSITPESESREDALEERVAVMLEQDPLVRVAAKRAFGRHGIKTFHYSSADEYLRMTRKLLDDGKFFVAFVSLPVAADDLDRMLRVVAFLKKENREIPVVVLSATHDFRVRHRALSEGADVFLAKPDAAGQRGAAGPLEEELGLLADELVLLAERYLKRWEEGPGERTVAPEGGSFFDLAKRDKVNRSFSLIKSLISELTNPNEISEVSLMILRLAAEYAERAILFLAGRQEFIGLGGFGLTGDLLPMNLRARKIRIPVGEPSIFADVVAARATHRGKLRRTPWNEELINQAGKVFPNEVVVIPILNRDRVIALLYGDNAEFKKPIGNIDGLEIFLSQAGFAFENALAAKRRAHDGGA